MKREAYEHQVQSFLDSKVIAVAGYSTTKGQPANAIYDRLQKGAYTVFAINPNHDRIGDVTCYPNLNACPIRPEAVVCATPPSGTVEVVKDGLAMQIDKFWIHRSIDKGSYHPEVEELCKESGALCLTSGCPLMYVNPDFFHRIIKNVMGWRGKLEGCPATRVEV